MGIQSDKRNYPRLVQSHQFTVLVRVLHSDDESLFFITCVRNHSPNGCRVLFDNKLSGTLPEWSNMRNLALLYVFVVLENEDRGPLYHEGLQSLNGVLTSEFVAGLWATTTSPELFQNGPI